MRYLVLLFIVLLSAACVRSSAEPTPTTRPKFADAPSTMPSAKLDESEAAYARKTAVVRLLQEWGREPGVETPFDHVVAEEISGMPGNYVAICDVCENWGGFACCLKVEHGRITKLWVLEEQGEQSMGSVSSKFVNGPSGPIPIVIAFGCTHMGHGSLYIYEYTTEGPRLLLETPAVDHHLDTDLFRGGELHPMFDDLNGDGCCDLTLLGIRDTYPEGDDSSAPTRSDVIQRVYVFDKPKHKLVEDVSRRIGYRRLGD